MTFDMSFLFYIHSLKYKYIIENHPVNTVHLYIYTVKITLLKFIERVEKVETTYTITVSLKALIGHFADCQSFRVLRCFESLLYHYLKTLLQFTRDNAYVG